MFQPLNQQQVYQMLDAFAAGSPAATPSQPMYGAQPAARGGGGLQKMMKAKSMFSGAPTAMGAPTTGQVGALTAGLGPVSANYAASLGAGMSAAGETGAAAGGASGGGLLAGL